LVRHFKADVFKALSHPTRIRILDALRDGELTVGELQARLTVEQPTLSQHLGALRSRDFIRGRRAATSVFYSVADRAIWDLLDTARDIYERRLGRNQTQLEASR
jgi:DNA-binding transcriptional ArsR family regulator